jgi:2-haloacid dehalogenase
MTIKVVVFDVNETLLDLSPLRPRFESVFGSADPIGEWFARLLHGSLVANHTDNYRPFGMIGVEALLVTAQRRGVTLDPEQASDIVAELRRLPPHPDVPAGLEALRGAGFRMVTLTNSSIDAVTAQLENASLASFFEASLSVDAVRRFKPAPEVYRNAATTLESEVDELLLVAAHDWDIIGARAVGMPGAFIARPGVVWGLPDPQPDIVVPDIGALAERLAETTQPARP